MPVDLHEVIEDSITDAELTPEPVEVDATPDSAPEPALEATPEAPEATTETPEVVSPAVKTDLSKPEPDEFEKEFGVPKMSASGRENRIPFSRVQKISQNAAGKATKSLAEKILGRKLNPGEKAEDLVTAHVARLPELETKLKDYEGRLGQVAQFERIMDKDPSRFLEMLSRLPQYAPFFDALEKAYNTPAQETPALDPALLSADMPGPDQDLPDGSKYYSMDGLAKLLQWHGGQVEARVTKQLEDKISQRYAPIENEWAAHQRIQSVIPKVQAQINEARSWAKFNENEEDIVKALQADPNLSLEGAYRKVVLPRLAADRDSMRAEILAEIKKTPTSTSAPSRSSKPVGSGGSSSPKSLEDVIKAAIQPLKG